MLKKKYFLLDKKTKEVMGNANEELQFDSLKEAEEYLYERRFGDISGWNNSTLICCVEKEVSPSLEFVEV